jgi:TetR/AcrR family transcriptional regulator
MILFVTTVTMSTVPARLARMSTADRQPGGKRSEPRRSPGPDERQRDADRTRRRILDAAVEEFSAKGFAGTRVAEIAKRAGVNAQLITYYFNGKQGLYDALREAWATAQSGFAAPDQPFTKIVRSYLDAVLDQPAQSRLLLWQALDEEPVDADGAQAEQVRNAVDDLRRRQKAGEITEEFDPESILVILWAAALAPLTIPHIVNAAFGGDLSTPAVRNRYATQLERLFTSAAPSASNEDGDETNKTIAARKR